MKYIQVFWRDAFSDSAWKTVDDIKDWVKKNHDEVCVSIGEQVHEDKYYLVLAGSNNGSDEYGELTAIPKNWIVEIKMISNPDDVKVHV
jgi:hypothetical protein